MCLVFEIVGVISYVKVGYDSKLWLFGFLGSIVNMFGGVFAISAFASGAPLGPIGALLGTQRIILVILYAFLDWKVPPWVQILALIIGIIGSLILSIPATLHKFLLFVITCGTISN